MSVPKNACQWAPNATNSSNYALVSPHELLTSVVLQDSSLESSLDGSLVCCVETSLSIHLVALWHQVTWSILIWMIG